jgi:hypothetical protein
MIPLFGCEPVQARLYLLVGMEPERITAQYPELGSHLGWCPRCREQLAELIVIEGLDPAGGPAVAPSSGPRWCAVEDAIGRVIRELVGRTIVRVQRGVAIVVEAPAGLELLPVPLGVARGGVTDRRQRLRLVLDDSGLTADVAFHPDGEDRVAVEITVAANHPSPLSIALHEGDGERTRLLASQTTRTGERLVFRSVPPGSYALDVVVRETAERFRARLDVVATG